MSRGLIFGEPAEGATVQVRRPSGEILSSVAAGSMGQFSPMVSTGGSPVDAYASVTDPGFPQHHFVPAEPLSADLDLGGLNIFNETGWNDLAATAGTTWDTTKGNLAVFVRDCESADVGGAVVGLSPSSGTPLVSGSYLFIFNVEPGLTTVSATGFGHTFRSRTINVQPGVATWVWLRP